MHGAGLPPRPDLLADEGQERGEQALEGRERDPKRAARRRRPVGGAFIAAPLDELEVVVAVPPEGLLGAIERARVVVLLEAARGLIDYLGDPREEGPVERLR